MRLAKPTALLTSNVSSFRVKPPADAVMKRLPVMLTSDMPSARETSCRPQMKVPPLAKVTSVAICKAPTEILGSKTKPGTPGARMRPVSKVMLDVPLGANVPKPPRAPEVKVSGLVKVTPELRIRPPLGALSVTAPVPAAVLP